MCRDFYIFYFYYSKSLASEPLGFDQTEVANHWFEATCWVSAMRKTEQTDARSFSAAQSYMQLHDQTQLQISINLNKDNYRALLLRRGELTHLDLMTRLMIHCHTYSDTLRLMIHCFSYSDTLLHCRHWVWNMVNITIFTYFHHWSWIYDDTFQLYHQSV